MLQARQLLLTLIVFTATRCRAGGLGYFINPPSGPCESANQAVVYDLGNTVNVQWSTNFSSLALYLLQGVNGATQSTQFYTVSGEIGMWTVNTLGLDLDANPTFSFAAYALRHYIAYGPLFVSSCFNITNTTTITVTAAPSSTLVSQLSVSSPATSATHTLHSGTISATPPPTLTPGVRRKEVVIGAGIGVGLGLPLLALGTGLGFFLLWKKRGKEHRVSFADQKDGISNLPPELSSSGTP